MAHALANADSPQILLVKTSSLGDVVHNLPVISDILRHFPGAQIDWLVEDCFAALPKLHPTVRNVLSVSVRRWRGQLLSNSTWREISAFRANLSAQHYDFAIDTQGLLKSSLLMRGATGLRCGFDRQVSREPLAACFYQRTIVVPTGQHAVDRNRQLVSQSLGYQLDQPADFGISLNSVAPFEWLPPVKYAVLLHATSRDDKLWGESNWISLGRTLHEHGILCILPWGNENEKARSLRLAKIIPNAVTPPQLDLNQVSVLLSTATCVIGVDTGLAHLAAALDIPTVGIYTATNPTLTGLYPSNHIVNLGNVDCPPDVASVLSALHQVFKF